MTFSFDHSPLWLLLILPMGGLVAWWLYFHKNRHEDWGAKLRAGLAALRFVVLALLAFLLLKPFVVSLLNESEKPKLIVFDDYSLSVPEGERGSGAQLVENHLSDLETKYDVEHLRFGADAGESGIDSFQTNFENLIHALNEHFYNQNIGAVVVATDGVQTIGADPRHMNLRTAAPLFALALGDSAHKPDLQITEVLNNRMVFQGNEFEVRVRYTATMLAGQEAAFTLQDNAGALANQKITFTNGQQSGELTFKIKAAKAGLNRYTVAATRFSSEPNTTNNSAQFFVDVLDNRTKVLIVAKSPHPDVAAIRQAIAANEQYEVQATLLADWIGSADNVDLLILHGLPSDANDMNKIKVARDRKIPTLCVITPAVSLLHFEKMDMGLKITANRKNTDEAGAWMNEGFNLFNLPRNAELSRFPPLNTLFGDYHTTGESFAVLNQRIGSIQTEKPLLLITQTDGWKRALLAGEGWWRWRLFDRMRDNSGWTDQMMVKTVQYLALKQKRTRLNITAPELLEEGREAVFAAEFYNSSYELMADADLRLTLTDSSDRELEYRFQNNGMGYGLSLGSMPVGSYNWRAWAQVDGERIAQEGSFTVNENKAEFVRLRADHGFLRQWTTKCNGQVFYPENAEDLAKALLNLETAKPIIHTSKEWSALIEWKWLACLIVLLLTIEWFLRKFFGGY